jgi:hypothetical protein
MCDIASEIYLEAREVAEHLTLLVARLEHCRDLATPMHLKRAHALLRRRGDLLAEAVLSHVEERLQAGPADPLASFLEGVPVPLPMG